MRICFTSVVIWPNKKVADKPKIFEKINNPDYDYFLFSNLTQEDFDTSWEVISIETILYVLDTSNSWVGNI